MLLFILLVLFQQGICYINATGVFSGQDPTTKQWPMRQEITSFSGSKEMFDLYIQALLRFQQDGPENPRSYYQIAGIHGYPRGPWDNVGGNGASGFCMHNSVLFPIWHRPYLALHEQILSEHVQIVARLYPAEQQSVYMEAANAFRMPYWDWVINPELPDVAVESQIAINTPFGFKNMTNPLYQYTFPHNMLARGLFPAFESSKVVSNLSRTVKHYQEQTDTNDLVGCSKELLLDSSNRLQEVYRLLASNGTWVAFSMAKSGGLDLESIHGRIHNAVGGISGVALEQATSGHMTVTDISAFDPIFWLHHANTDRLTAIWQALYDDVYVEPTLNSAGTYYIGQNTTDTQDTPLAPFHREGNEMWTAATARNITTFGYTYPELASTGRDGYNLKTAVLERINKLYNPGSQISPNSSRHLSRRNINIAQILSDVHADTALQLGVNNLEVQWYLRVITENQETLKKISVFFFVGEPPLDRSLWSSAPNLVGLRSPSLTFGPDRGGPVVYLDIPCTHIIAAAVDRGVIRGISAEAAVPFFLSHVTAKIIHPQLVDADDSEMQVLIISQSIQPRKTMAEFPQYGSFEEHGRLRNVDWEKL